MKERTWCSVHCNSQLCGRSNVGGTQQHLRTLNTAPDTDACADRYATMFGAELGLGVNNIKTPNDERLGILKVRSRGVGSE